VLRQMAISTEYCEGVAKAEAHDRPTRSRRGSADAALLAVGRSRKQPTTPTSPPGTLMSDLVRRLGALCPEVRAAT
jgi:hypothetical protein